MPPLVFSLIFLAIYFLSAASLNAQNPPAKRALIISLDGLDVRYLAEPDKYALKIPTLRRLMANGVTARGVYSVYPSVTYPNHTSLVTGVKPAIHGIFGNSLFEPPVPKPTGAGNWYARDIKADTLWQAAKRSGMTVGLVSWPVGVGAGDWNISEIWAPGGTQMDTRKVISQNSLPAGLPAEIEGKYRDLYRNVTADEGDDARTRIGEYILTEKRPNVMLIHLFDLDHFQHDYGPFTPEAHSAIEKSDAYVARLLAALERAGTLNETAVFITSDHDFKPISRQVHPGVLLRKAGLVDGTIEKDESSRERFVATDWKAAVYVTGASCAIYLRDSSDKASMKALRETFEPLAGKPDSGIAKVLDARALKRIGSNTSATLMLEAAEGFTFGGSYSGEPIVASLSKGMHGYLPTTPDFFASFIASGAGISGRGWIGLMEMPDAGTTIAAVIGLKLKNATGKPANLLNAKKNVERRANLR